MVVGFDLEDRCEAVADVDRSGVLSRPLEHLGTFGRQRSQMHARALVTAVLRPHHREDAELRQVRLSPHERDDAFVFVRLDAVTLQCLLIDHAGANAFTMDSRMTSPSVPPSAASQARSGCGIMPTTLRRSLQMPAIACADPFGFESSATSPSAVL